MRFEAPVRAIADSAVLLSFVIESMHANTSTASWRIAFMNLLHSMHDRPRLERIEVITNRSELEHKQQQRDTLQRLIQ